MLLTMKKILAFSSAKVLGLCGLGLLLTLGGFWHHQSYQSQLDRMNVLNQGVGTCFNRISQTFTALMIKDIQSPYLNRGFMALSDECLSETIKGINPFKQSVGKGHEILNKLLSEVSWFHEMALKIHSPMLAGQNLNPSMNPLSEKFSKMEGLKVDLVDEIDATSGQIRKIQGNDEIVMGMGLLMFVLALSVLALKEFNKLQLQREIEKKALNLLKAGQQNVGALVDQLVDQALVSQSMPVTAQIFRDYHGDLLERNAMKENGKKASKEKAETSLEVVEKNDNVSMSRASLKEVLVSLQNIHTKEVLQLSDVRDVQLAVDYESFEQLLNAAVNKLLTKRPGNKKILVSNQIHSDRSIVNFFLADNTFSASELEFCQSKENSLIDGVDMNLVVLKEMIAETGANWNIENKTDRNGKITGMSIRFTVDRVPKDNRKNLVSVVKGKKKDLAREMMN